jgi:hypothetical protein
LFENQWLTMPVLTSASWARSRIVVATNPRSAISFVELRRICSRLIGPIPCFGTSVSSPYACRSGSSLSRDGRFKGGHSRPKQQVARERE